MTFPSRYLSPEKPFFRLLVSFQSMLTINCNCHSLKILHFIRTYFSLLNNSLPIILHEVITNKEIILKNEINILIQINSGIYLAFIKYDEMIYQPLIDLTLIPKEIFPEKIFLPKTIPFVIHEITLFVKLLSNMIDYMKEYEKTKLICRKSSQNFTQRFSSPDLLQTPLSTSSIFPLFSNYNIDIRKYIVTDLQRINAKSPPFFFRILNRDEQIYPMQIRDNKTKFFSIIENSQFNENDLVLFKQNSFLSFPLELKNCIHQLAIDEKLEYPEIYNILLKLDQNIINTEDIPNIIRNLQNVTTIHRKEISVINLSNLMRILLRIDQLEKFQKLNSNEVQIFNQRFYHLAQLGVLNQQIKILKKLFQLDLFESEPNQQNFSQFIHDDLQKIIPKQIPLNSLGMKELIHQLYININHLGIVQTLILIDNLQQIIHSGLLLILNKIPQLKKYLILFIEHIQTGRCIGVYLQRLIEQMNNYLHINTIKKITFTNQLNSILQKEKLISKNTYEQLISNLTNLAYQGKLNTYTNIKINEQIIDIQNDIDDNNLQSLLLFLYEQDSLSSKSINNFIQYLRHFSQIGILDEPKLCFLLNFLHKAKDQNNISIEIFENIFEQIKTIDYLYAYHHLNLIEFNQFLNEMISLGELTLGQSLFALNYLIDLCRIESITIYDIKYLLTNLQLEYNRQQIIYPKLIDLLEILAESYSKTLTELHLFERELEKFIFSSNMKRISEDIRKRLNDIIICCKKIRNNRILVEELFGEKMNYKFYNIVKDIFKTKNFIHRKQSLTAIVQIHKHFINISRLQTQNFLSDQQLDLILQNIQMKCPKQQTFFEEIIKNTAKLGYLQDKIFVDYLTQHFLSNDSSILTSEKCLTIQTKLQTWLFTIDFNHSQIQPIIKHLTQLENQEQIDSGTFIEIQNYLNQIARFGKYFSPQIQILCNKILESHGKKFLSDKNGFQTIQSYRLILNDITHAIELEFFIQNLASKYQILDNLNYNYRDFLYQILQNKLSINELIRYRKQLKYRNIEEIKRFINLLPKKSDQLFPLALTDKLLKRLEWDGKIIEKSIREQLLKFERFGILTKDNFEDIFNHLSHNTDLSFFSSENKKSNQLFYDLFDKINNLVLDDLINLNQSIDIKEEIYLLENMIELIDISKIITIQSRLFNSSNQNEFQKISQELKIFFNQEQFRLSKTSDLISKWHLNKEQNTSNEKQIIKLLNELADLKYLYNNSTISILNRYLEMKHINQVTHRNFLKDLQRLKEHAINDRQAIECIRSIEIHLYKIDYKKRFDEILIKKIENYLKQIFNFLSHSFEQQYRNDICKKLNELVEIYIRSNTNEYSSEELLKTFDSYIIQMKQNQRRSSKILHHSSNTNILTISPSLKSIQSI